MSTTGNFEEGPLKPGLVSERSYTVTSEMSPPHLPVEVLSTPAMIGLIEGTCLELTQPLLREGETTVGVHVSVSHTGPAMAGEEVLIETTLQEVEGRKLLFEVEVSSPRGTISTGTHRRAVVDSSRFG